VQLVVQGNDQPEPLRVVQVPRLRLLPGAELAPTLTAAHVAHLCALCRRRPERRWHHVLQARMRPEPFAVFGAAGRVPWGA